MDSEWLTGYKGGAFFDEVFTAGGDVRLEYAGVVAAMRRLKPGDVDSRRALADLAFRNQGITFTVYGDPAGTERTFPFDVFPRVIPAADWRVISAGLVQRVKALNAFLIDVYHEGQILHEGVMPRALVLGNPVFRREVHGVAVPHNVYTHVAGIDIVRGDAGEYFVLEDNVRVPSGASYMLANRRVMARLFPEIFAGRGVELVEHYPDLLLRTLSSLSPRDVERPTVVVLTPGPYNSAYFEHVFLAQQMGVELVEGSDLYVDDGRVWMRTTQGRQQVDVIYRRLDDDFIDPVAFRPDSQLGVPGLVEVYRQGRVALANALGAGVADDKAIYSYVPKMITYYLNEQPILKNIPTYLGAEPEGRERIFDNAADLVIKRVDQSGGYGMLIGPAATAQERADYLAQVQAAPGSYIAQPVLGLSTHPTHAADTGQYEPRHIDLRPFVLSGETVTVVPGGLTRVALRRGSLVVNSSQGGGSKDTWVVNS